jgi:hypothetical protein
MQIVQKVANAAQARALPLGSVVGDLHGGLTFTDSVAEALEARSASGWQEVESGGKIWTVIALDKTSAPAG